MTPPIPAMYPQHWTWNEYCSLEKYGKQETQILIGLCKELPDCRPTGYAGYKRLFKFTGGVGFIELAKWEDTARVVIRTANQEEVRTIDLLTLNIA